MNFVLLFFSLPKWRNWQTRQTQNLVPFVRSAGSTPAFGTTFIMDGNYLWKNQEFLKKLRAKLLKIASLHIKNENKAEDIVQETIFIFLDNVSKNYYRGIKNEPGLIGYAIGILKHLIIKELKNTKKRINFIAAEKKLKQNFSNREIFSREGEEILIQKEYEEEKEKIIKIVEAEIEKMPPEIRELIELHIFEKWSYSKLSNHFGIPKQTLVYKFNKAMEKIRKKIKIFIQFEKLNNIDYENEKEEK